MSTADFSAREARRIALAAQGFAAPRPRGKIDRRHLRKVIEQIGLIQIDAVNVLVRSQELPLFARLGPHPRSLIFDATEAGELFEYWAHEASHVSMDHYQLFRWKMAKEHRWKDVESMRTKRPDFMSVVLERVAQSGPVVSGDFNSRVGPKGAWWDWDDAKLALEHLFWTGEVTARRRRSDFARLYHLRERWIPAEVLARPIPSENEARKQLLLLAAKHHGIGTLGDLSDYYRQKNAPCKPLVNELVEEGLLRQVTVEGWAQPAYMHAAARVPRRVSARGLLSPFDSLVFNRERTERVFNFRYRIEIYTPPPKRIYGYYVLPFLLGEDLVGRLDLKADRQNSTLLVQSAFGEPGVPPEAIVGELAEELQLMAGWLGLSSVTVMPRGDLATALSKAM